MPAIEELIKQINDKQWMVLNLFQYGWNDKVMWRCNLQRRSMNGATQDIFTEFADGKTALEAVTAALASAEARMAVDKRLRVEDTTTLTAGQEKRIASALARLTAVVETDDGTGGKG